jgi:hypothetical protein
MDSPTYEVGRYSEVLYVRITGKTEKKKDN